jgi:sporulation protein YlmC with PRC-barrel domain
MRHVLAAAAFAIVAGTAAYAQEPATKPDPNAAHPPTNRMDDATPTMKAPSGEAEHAPTNRVDQAVPPMKPTDPQSADTGTKTGTFSASDEWIGRSIYSSDGKELGKVASVQQGDLNADLGGFLGIGSTRTLIKADQIQDVKDDRIVLRLTDAEAKNLPAAEEKSPQQ